MAERLHPGVFVEERARGLAPIQGVSTSNYGTVGFTLKGPTNVATLVTSFEQFERTFGTFTEKGQVPTHLFAFFSNGGRRGFVVRVVASDAVAADGFVTSDESEEVIATGDGSTVDYTAAGAGPLALDHFPVEDTGSSPGSVSITYRPLGAAIAFASLTADVAPDGTAGVGSVTTNVFSITAGADEVVPGTVTLNTLVSAGAITYVDTNKDGVLLDGAGDARGFIDYRTGTITIAYELTGSGGALDQVPDSGSSPTLNYSPPGTLQTITDDGVGGLIGTALDTGGTIVPAPTATIDYLTGAVEFSVNQGVRATETLTFTGNALDTETVVIDVKTYTFQTVLTNVDGNVLIGATASDSLDNLIAAINLGAGAGTLYALATTLHPTVSAAAGVGDTMDAEAKAGGTAGNTIATTETITAGTWGGATLSGGVDSVLAPHDLEQILAAYTAEPFDVDPISAGAWGNDVSIQVRGNEDNFTRATASYSLHDVLVLLEGIVEEIFTGVSLTDPTAVNYVISKINAPGTGSSLVDLVEPSSEDIKPDNLDGKLRNLHGGSGNGSQADFGSTGAADPDGFPEIPLAFRVPALPTPVQAASVTITYTDSAGTARTITDDGAGNLVGDVDLGAPAGSNAIDYTSGKFAFRSVAAVSEAETTNGAGASVVTVPGSEINVALFNTPASALNTDALSNGSDGVAPIVRAQLTSPILKTDRQGMFALLTTDELLNIGIPDAAGNVTMALDQITEAETNGKWFIILATPAGLSPQGAKDYRRNDLGTSSSYGALYYPYITIADPVTDSALNIPPIGHIAGAYARTDSTKSVGKAPAGTIDGRLLFSIGLERILEFGEIDVFFQSQVNALVDTPQTGRVIWGARTLENPPGDFRFVHVRRLFNFLKASIFNSTHGFVFENVGAALRSRITLSVESFLRNLFNQGLFAGETPQEAFTVICDQSNNPPEVEAAGEVICDIFIAPNTPGEFIIFRIQQKFEST